MSRSCVTIITVLPDAARPLKSCKISSEVCKSRFPVGSSAMSKAGSLASARAIAARCCWPPERSAGSLYACSLIPTCSSRRSARPLRSRAGIMPQKSMGSITFSRMVSVGRSWKNWNTTPTFLLRHFASWSWSILWIVVSPIHISPDVGLSIPLNILRMVDFPLPDLPIMATNSPGFTCKLTSRRAWNVPPTPSWVLVTPVNLIRFSLFMFYHLFHQRKNWSGDA